MSEHSASEVERVAKAIYEADGTVIPWAEISERERDGYRGLATAALSALPPRDDSAERFVEFVRGQFRAHNLDALIAIGRELDRLDAARKAKP